MLRQELLVAEVMDQVVSADPSNKEARSPAADAFEQLGYVSDSSTWRNAYQLGVQELRGESAVDRDAFVASAQLRSLEADYCHSIRSMIRPFARAARR
jgi:alkyl sulfatase BDS1-like metallo-beta-lactamase superfamily hydrolase